MNNATENSKESRNRVGSKELASLLSEWESVAFGHESVFLERFCHDAWQLVGVYWCSEKMKVVYVLDSGQHVTDSIPLNEWLEFYEANAAEPVRCENCGKPAVRLTEDGINLCRECYALCPEDTQNEKDQPLRAAGAGDSTKGKS